MTGAVPEPYDLQGESGLLPPWWRLARVVALAIILGVGISQVILTIGDWHLRDMEAYWQAASRLREGGALYPPVGDTEASEVFRYAPWFAWVWIPLTLLPHDIVRVIWSIMLLAASAAALAPIMRRRAWIVVALMAPILFAISGGGNAHPLLIAALVHGVERRSGPLWIAAAASLKAVPILLVLTYCGRGQWIRAGLTVLATAALTAPVLLFDLTHYSTDPGYAGALIELLPLFVLTVIGAAVASVVLARGPYGWLASSASVVVATPRLFVYDITYVITAFAGPRNERNSDATGKKA